MKVQAFVLSLTLCAAAGLCAGPAGPTIREIPLWSDVNPEPDVFEMPANGDLPKRFTVVNRPSIYVFLPPKDKTTGVAVVVAPGGGHSQLVIDKVGCQWKSPGLVLRFQNRN